MPFTTINLSSRRLLLVVWATFCFIVVFSIAGKVKVSAITENTTYVPSFESNFDKNCSGYKHYQDVWLSDAGDNSVTLIDVNEGTNSINMRLNVISAHCNTNIDANGNIVNKSIEVTRTTLVDRGVRVTDMSDNPATTNGCILTPGTPCISSGLTVDSYWDISYKDSHDKNYRYIKDGGKDAQPVYRAFTVSGLNGLGPGMYKVWVRAAVNMVHRYNGPVYRCVDPTGPSVASSLDDPKCGDAGPEWLAYIRILPVDHAPTGSATVSCSTISGSATDKEGSPVRIHVYIDGVGYDLGDVANPNFSWAFPTAHKDAFVNHVQVWALNIPRAGAPTPAGNTKIADVTLSNPCRPPTCNPVISDPVDPEYNTDFGEQASFNYPADNSIGRAFEWYAQVDVSTATPGTGTSAQYWSTRGAGAGANRQDNILIKPPFRISTPGTYTVGFRLYYRRNSSSPWQTSTDPRCNGGGNFTSQISRKPYYKIYGNDAQVGSKYENSCTAAASSATFRGFNIAGTNSPNGQYDYFRGAGAQFALFALGAIQEVASSGMKTFTRTSEELGATNKYPTRQTFANWSPSAYATGYGGNSGISRCIPDYVSKNPINNPASLSSVTPGSNIASSIDVDGTNIAYITSSSGSPITINGQDFSSPLAVHKNQVVYVRGDARIADGVNIKYGAFNGTNVPSFTLVVDGNLYIDNDTSQLDGTYIVQNKSVPAKGIVYTCYLSVAARPANIAEIPNDCNHKLTFNGAVIARQIKLWRSNGSLSEGLTSVTPPQQFNFRFTGGDHSSDSNCVRIYEPSDGAGTWSDNWLCMDPGIIAKYGVVWSNSGQVAGKSCVKFDEPSDYSHGWNNNYLCYDNRDSHNLAFYYGGPRPFPGASYYDGTYGSSPTPAPWINNDKVPSQWTGINAATGKQVQCYRIMEAADSSIGIVQYGWTIDHNGTWADNWLCEDKFAVVSPSTGPEVSEPNDNISEVFNGSPEIYLQPTNFTPNSTKGKYDSISSRPPVL